jgi:hypothetical protein
MDTGGNQRQIDFFETKIRPVLIEHCYECHQGRRTKSREALGWITARGCCPEEIRGRRSFREIPRIVRLLAALRYDGLEMPPAR